jgi:hypothetical protein
MSVIGLVNLAERLLNQGSPQGQDLPTTRKGTNTAATNNAAGPAEDLFTPSAQNSPTQNAAQDAGLFSVTQFSFFSAAADFLLGQNIAPPTPTATPAPTTSDGNGAAGLQHTFGKNLPGFAVPQPIGNQGPLGAAVNGGNGANTAAGTATTVPATTKGAATSAATITPGSLAAQQQFQSLNTALAALGLTPQEIQQLDRIASILNDFDPTAYTALAYQLEQLAQAQQPTATPTTGGNAPNTAANPASNNTPTANGATANTTNDNGNAFQIQELAIKFAGVPVQGGTAANGTGAAAQGTPAAGNGTFQATAFHLQVEELNLTLTNGNGQTAQLYVPQADEPALKARAAGA